MFVLIAVGRCICTGSMILGFFALQCVVCGYYTVDFKSSASASSATPAQAKLLYNEGAIASSGLSSCRSKFCFIVLPLVVISVLEPFSPYSLLPGLLP